MRDHDKIVLVTGSSSGIGQACCEMLGSEHIVYGASRTQTSSKLWTFFKMDVTDPASVEDGMREIHARHSRIDAVIHCAGFGVAGPAEESADSMVKDQFETNYLGTVRVAKAALPYMREQGGGRIILIGSIAGLIGLPFQAHYSATKFALDGFAEALRHEVRPFAIYVSILHAGNFKTAFNRSRVYAKIEEESPYKQACARAAAFYESGEMKGAAPEIVAGRVGRILRARRPRLRYVVGSPIELAGVLGKRVLPSNVFEQLFSLFYFSKAVTDHSRNV
jgi:NAD(P)-dependent dehydrogenase (short-subunit alcohol dehydrogenase family)